SIDYNRGSKFGFPGFTIYPLFPTFNTRITHEVESIPELVVLIKDEPINLRYEAFYLMVPHPFKYATGLFYLFIISIRVVLWSQSYESANTK
ncbi:MAG: hypothetical protein G01um101470_703, partial [Parcubacteria group bacterium Gr01-1014_70]